MQSHHRHISISEEFQTPQENKFIIPREVATAHVVNTRVLIAIKCAIPSKRFITNSNHQTRLVRPSAITSEIEKGRVRVRQKSHEKPMIRSLFHHGFSSSHNGTHALIATIWAVKRHREPWQRPETRQGDKTKEAPRPRQDETRPEKTP